jgi:hypothetical protein
MVFFPRTALKHQPRTRPVWSGWKPKVETLEDRTLLSFSAAINYPAGNTPQDMVAGDFTGNGILDLATVNSSVVNILLGNGDGTF